MRTLVKALLLGAMAASAVPALAQDDTARRIGEQLRGGITDDDRDERRRERWERRDERRDDRTERREDRAERREERREDWEREQRRRWEQAERRRWEAERRYDRRYDYGRYDPWGYRYGGTPWDRSWTPYGFGYDDPFTRDWVLRNFADRNRNGRVTDKEWRRAQEAFYRLADRDRDGRISRGEYDWALRTLRYNYGYRR